MKQIYRITLVCILSHFSLFAQEIASSETNSQSNTTYQSNTNGIQQNTPPSFDGYWSYGGSLGFSFWNNGTDILIAPKAFYNISPMLQAGFGVTYIYSDYKNSFNNTVKSNSFGGSLYFSARPINFIQLSAEYEGLQTNRSGYYDDSYWNNSIYLGLAFVSGHVSFGLRYDVLYDSAKSPYSSAVNPVIGFYF
ncbi:hypothetical protein ACFQ5N_11235 [Lutibacter holmesii]|uniref:Alpha-ketoglutarate decarboxylase n=1 Tax=Lutibacter holmesii TaxID=1137985 RepID=A0ABW3WPU3_9FLAO